MVKVILFFLCCAFSTSIFAIHQESLLTPWGKGSDLACPVNPAPPQNDSSKISTSLIRFYQNYISPIDGPRSSYLPCSSEYTRRAIKKYGFLKGTVMGCDRLMRENKALWVYETKMTADGERKLDPVR